MIHLYSDPRCPFSHSIRLILNEKDMDYKIIDVNINSRQDLMHLNPENKTPVLVDDIDKNNKKKDLILLDVYIMAEYIDERFPHPQLMPIEPSEKARMRMALFKLNQSLYNHIRFLEDNLNAKETKTKKEVEKRKTFIVSTLDEIALIFTLNKKMEFFASGSFSLMDVFLLPLLWRLNYYNIAPKKNWEALLKYAKAQFSRNGFTGSLTPAERGMLQE